MNLIEELSAYIRQISPHPSGRTAQLLKRSITALEAAQEMNECLDIYHTLAKGAVTKAAIAQKQFREAMSAKNDNCKWYQNTNGNWETGCGACWELLDGPPSKHRMHFCPCCGRALVETPRQEMGATK